MEINHFIIVLNIGKKQVNIKEGDILILYFNNKGGKIMHWQEAVLKSKVNRAVRRTKDGRKVLRYQRGITLIEMRGGAGLRIAMGGEMEGHLDWEPDTPNLYL